MALESRGSRAGFTLIEAVVSIVIVGLMMAATLNTVGAARFGQWKTASQSRGQKLGFDLLDEVLAQAYADPAGSTGLGLESDEQADAGRTEFDDVDDYDQWTASPPQRRDGTVIEAADDFGRSVRVSRVDPRTLEPGSSTDTRVKRIIVTVTRRGAVLARVEALKSAVADRTGR